MFPQTVLGNKVEMFYNGQWNNITPTYVRGLGAEDGEIAIGMRGQPDESSGITTTTAELSLNNRDGRFSMRNAMSDLYGLIGLNTPLRISSDLSATASIVDSFDTAGTDGWPDSDSGHAYTVAGTASEYFVSGGVATMRHAAVNTEHSATITTVITDIDGAVDVAVEATPTGGPVEITLRSRINGTTWVQGRLVFTTSNTVQVGIEYSVSGVTTTTALSTVAGLTTADTVRFRFQTLGRTLRIRAWESGTDEPSTWEVEQETTVLIPGSIALTSILDSANTNTLPYDVTFDNLEISLGVILCVLEITEWPKKWDTTGTDVWVTIQASGITRRLNQGSRLLGSALSRALSQLDLRGYWSFEDLTGELETHDTIASSLEDGNPFVVTDFASFSTAKVEYSGDTTLVGSGGLPSLSMSDEAIGIVGYDSALVETGTGNQFSVCFWTYTGITADDLNVATTITILFTATGGTFTQWTMNVDQQDVAGTKSLVIGAFADDGAVFNASGSTTYQNKWRFVRFTVDQPGANQMRLRTYVDEVLIDTETEASGVPNIGQPAFVQRFGAETDNSNVDISFGHFAVAGGTGGDPIADNAATIYTAGYTGFSGETTVDRITRLCTERGVALEVVGASTTTMGPQKSQTFVDTLEEIARTEDGIIYELRSDLGYGFRTRESLYGATTSLALDYADTDLSELPEVTDDDKDVVNLIEVTNDNGGGTVVRSQTTGPMSIENIGLYDDGANVNFETDAQLPDYASWRIHVGTWDAQRWPGLSVALHRTPMTTDLAKLTAAVFLDVSEVITLSSPPSWLGQDSIAMQMRAVRMFLSNFTWGIDWTLLPAGPWSNLASVENTDYGRADTTGSELVSAVDTDDTEWVVHTPETDLPFTGALWTEDMGQLNHSGASGIDFRMNPPSRVGGLGGERVRVAATASRTDTFTRSGQLSGSNADSGQTWVNTSGTAADATTDGTRAVLLHGSANTVLWQTLPGPGADQLFNVDVAFNTGAATGGGLLRASAILRQTDTNNFVEVRVTLPASGAAQAELSIRKMIGGVSTVISSTSTTYTVPYTANAVIKVKATTNRRGVFAKFWLSTSDEPDWLISLPDDVRDLVSGSDIAIYSERATGNTNANATMYFDNLTVITPKIRPYASDMFGRSVSAGFGSADVGGAWSNLIFGGVAADLDVVNPAATTTFTAANIQLGGFLDDVDLTNVCVGQAMALGALPTGASLSSSILLRGNAGPLAIVCRASVATSTFSHAITLSITAADGTVLGTKTLGKFYSVTLKMKAAAIGTDVMMKVWDRNENEPDYWQLVVEDTTSDPVSGWVGFLNERVTGNTNANVVISVFDFRVINPQRFTVQRSINNVTKSWPAENDIRLWTPARLGR